MENFSEINIEKLSKIIDEQPNGSVNYVLCHIINMPEDGSLDLANKLSKSIKDNKVLYFDEEAKLWEATRELKISIYRNNLYEDGKIKDINTVNLLLITIGLKENNEICLKLCEVLKNIISDPTTIFKGNLDDNGNVIITDTRQILAAVMEKKKIDNELYKELEVIRLKIDQVVRNSEDISKGNNNEEMASLVGTSTGRSDSVQREFDLLVTPASPRNEEMVNKVDPNMLLPPRPNWLTKKSSINRHQAHSLQEEKKEKTKDGCCIVL
jgi:hypothetical protein